MSLVFQGVPTCPLDIKGESTDLSSEVDSDEIHEQLCQEYGAGTEEIRKKAKEELKALPAFDPNYDEGVFFVQAAGFGDVDFLKWLVEKSDRDGNLRDNLQSALARTAYKGYLGCVKFLIGQGADPRSLTNTTAYNNHMPVQQFLEKYLEEMKKSTFRPEALLGTAATSFTIRATSVDILAASSSLA